MEIGLMRERVTIEEETETADSYGGRVSTWRMVCKWWARIEALAGKEFEQAKGYSATTSHRLTIPYRASLLPTQRITLGSRVFSIDAILGDEDKQFMTLMCTESVPG